MLGSPFCHWLTHRCWGWSALHALGIRVQCKCQHSISTGMWCACVCLVQRKLRGPKWGFMLHNWEDHWQRPQNDSAMPCGGWRLQAWTPWLFNFLFGMKQHVSHSAQKCKMHDSDPNHPPSVAINVVTAPHLMTNMPLVAVTLACWAPMIPSLWSHKCDNRGVNGSHQPPCRMRRTTVLGNQKSCFLLVCLQLPVNFFYVGLEMQPWHRSIGWHHQENTTCVWGQKCSRGTEQMDEAARRYDMCLRSRKSGIDCFVHCCHHSIRNMCC